LIGEEETLIRKLILKRLDKEERSLGESVDYVRHILRTSLPAFFKFALFTPLSQHRRKLPPAPYRVARIVATQDEDCGSCVQIEVNLAREDGVPAEVVRAVLNNRPEELTPELADVYRFAKAVVEASDGEAEFRERLRERYGEEGLVEMALGIAAARVFPVTKRALGYATSCALVEMKV
jgi:alkylhydroperoxidase family enzyme